MSESLSVLKERIERRHCGDKEQLRVIFSDSIRILVEAPAGYGKTNTMVSKIAYMLATNQVPNPKRLLALTFSVNAAYKIKKDVTQQLPELLGGLDLKIDSSKVIVSNYHGFCRIVLRKYGTLFDPSLTQIDKLQSVDDAEAQNVMELVENFDLEKATFLSNYSTEVKRGNKGFILSNLSKYNKIIVQDLLPNGIISFNAILTLTIELFEQNVQIRNFYRAYFIAILVDEFQDTNELSHRLLSLLITENTKVIFLGDSLQRIYGFIGAVPDLLETAQKEFNLMTIQLKTNHRFATNKQMLLLDRNIRKNAENPDNAHVTEDALIDLEILADQTNEAIRLVQKAATLVADNPESRVAILVKTRGYNTNEIVRAFESSGIPFFYGLFSDEDVAYMQFHKRCLYEFFELIKVRNHVTKPLSATHIARIRKFYQSRSGSLETALFTLLELFWQRVFTEYSFLTNDDKISFVRDTFEYNSLKQYIEFTDKKIVLSTIHAAKGLEWDFVQSQEQRSKYTFHQAR